MPRHEAWRLMYRNHRYCRHLSQVELNRRIRDIFLTLLSLTPEGKIGMLEMDPAGSHWMELWTHVLEEMTLRFGPYPAGFTRDILHLEPFPDLVGSLAKRASTALTHLPKAGVAIKFGKPEHMVALYERGALRVQSASFYRQPDHNGAIRDDELALEVSLSLDREQIVRVVRNPQDVPAGNIDQRLDIKYESRTDYWLYCVTTTVEPRLFVDFEAEACVVIKDTARFRESLRNAVESLVNPAYFRDGKVAYIDPLLPKSAAVDVPMSKHFRYAYQHEYRFAWLPSAPRWGLTCLDVAIGSMREYAELVVV
jgi:hypothetical protein